MHCRRKELHTLYDIQSMLKEEELPEIFWSALPRAVIPYCETRSMRYILRSRELSYLQMSRFPFYLSRH
jgi:hypothetical protein